MDLNDVIESFFAESMEGLDVMEGGLLKLQPGRVDGETINEIFRAAHSIKGGGGIFGFSEISEFMHGVETVLDDLRSGKREVTDELSQLLLETVDHARTMFTAARNKQTYDRQRTQALQTRIATFLQRPESTPTRAVEATPQASGRPLSADWHIRFRPHAGMLAKANDPLRMIRELQSLGELHSVVNIDNLPEFDALDPAECYLGWELQVTADCDENAIRDVFAWVVDECDLQVSGGPTYSAQPDMVTPLAAEADKTPEPEDIRTTVKEPAKKATPTAAPPVPANAAPATAGTGGAPESIRVSIDKVDNLINLVGELVITQSMLSRFEEQLSDTDFQQLINGLSQLARNTRDLQESVLQIRMLPIGFCLNRFPRLVHDIGNKLGKKVQLKLSGEDTELDKTVLERINDPLVHLVRNSLDHGLETPEQRLAAGKSEVGTLEIKAYQASGNIVIEVIDDGAGLNTEKIRRLAIERGLVNNEEVLTDQQINNLIFNAGFSTAETVNDLSGRGVGMDVVKRNINELGGDVWIESERGTGTHIHIKLPLTLAILDGQLLRVGQEIYIMPLMSIIKTLQVAPNKVNELPGGTVLYRMQDLHIPVIRLSDAFGVQADAAQLQDGLLIIVDSERQRYGIWVDELLDQQQVVIKSLESNFKHVPGISGATILGDGTVALILDVNGIVEQSGQRNASLNLAVA